MSNTFWAEASGTLATYCLENVKIIPDPQWGATLNFGTVTIRFTKPFIEELVEALQRRSGLLDPYADHNMLLIARDPVYKNVTVIMSQGPLFGDNTLLISEKERKAMIQSVWNAWKATEATKRILRSFEQHTDENPSHPHPDTTDSL